MVKNLVIFFWGVTLATSCLGQEVSFYSKQIDSCNCLELYKYLDSPLIGITPEVLPIMISKTDRYEKKISQFLVEKEVYCDIYLELIINKKGHVVCCRIIKGNKKYEKELLGILKDIKYHPGRNKDQPVNSITYLLLKYDKKNNLFLINY